MIENESEKRCFGCGTCIGMCPTDSLHLTDSDTGVISLINDSGKCIQCGKCLDYCPQLSFSDNNLDLCIDFLNSERFIGSPEMLAIGQSCDKDIQYTASSGGLITSLLKYAFDQNLITAAVVVKPVKNLFFKGYLARNTRDVLEAMGSKYIPIPLNMILKDIKNLDPDERIAIVGLPCHIKGIKSVIHKNEQLKTMIRYTFSLFCSHNLSREGTKQLVRCCDHNIDDLSGINYRGNGWPGSLILDFSDSKKILIGNHSIMWSRIFHNFFLIPDYCVRCDDLLGEYSDISFGDPWLSEVMEHEKSGKSLIVVRTNDGARLVQKAVDENIIYMEPISPRKVIQSQLRFLHFKKVNLLFRENIFSILIINKLLKRFTYLNIFIAILVLCCVNIGKKMPSELHWKFRKIEWKISQVVELLHLSAIQRDINLMKDIDG